MAHARTVRGRRGGGVGVGRRGAARGVRRAGAHIGTCPMSCLRHQRPRTRADFTHPRASFAYPRAVSFAEGLGGGSSGTAGRRSSCARRLDRPSWLRLGVAGAERGGRRWPASARRSCRCSGRFTSARPCSSSSSAALRALHGQKRSTTMISAVSEAPEHLTRASGPLRRRPAGRSAPAAFWRHGARRRARGTGGRVRVASGRRTVGGWLAGVPGSPTRRPRSALEARQGHAPRCDQSWVRVLSCLG